MDQEMNFSRSPSHEPSLYPRRDTGVEQSIVHPPPIANKIQIIIYNLSKKPTKSTVDFVGSSAGRRVEAVDEAGHHLAVFLEILVGIHRLVDQDLRGGELGVEQPQQQRGFRVVHLDGDGHHRPPSPGPSCPPFSW